MLTSLQDTIYTYESELDYFFEKMKLTPAKLCFTLFKLESKELQYLKLIKQSYPKLGEHFSDMIVSLF